MEPILIHIGYHKTGSGWLRRVFFVNPATGFGWIGKSKPSHPVRRLVAARPLEFDPVAARAEFDPLLQHVRDDGLLPVVAFERLAGHPFSGGYDSKEIADRLAAVFPEGRVLAVIREQKAMILSTYKQYVRQGGTLPLPEFVRPPAPKSMPGPSFDLAYFEYHHLLEYYRRLFGKERILTLTYEQFRTDPRAFVADIACFSGRPLSDEALTSLPFETPSNPSPLALAIDLRRRLNKLAWKSEVNPSPLFRSTMMTRPVRALGQALEHKSFVPQRWDEAREAALRDTIAEIVGDRYAASNRATAGLSGLDLAALGWTV